MAEKQDVWRRMGTASRVLNTEIRKEIVRQRAVDTTRMRNVTKMMTIEWDDTKDDFTIILDTTEYYKYVDEAKARKWKGGNTPRDLTKAFMKREKVLDQLDKLMEVIFEYRIDQQFR